ncbi:MAG: hypothetical protein JW869_00500 [Candidatus Omnitrophica bacterium]|nr:hypothetical protein [Candidatus Omnitrophota bacterium]
MKKIFFLILFLILNSAFLAAEQPRQEQKRRVEQEKRDSLRHSEVQPETFLEPLQPEEKPIETTRPAYFSYFSELVQRRISYGWDICRAVVILMGREQEYKDLDSQLTYLQDQQLLPKKYLANFDPKLPLRRGLAAYIFCKLLDIKGGVILRTFGVSERYALKELEFEGIMGQGHVNDIISGEELVVILTQAANYLAEQRKQTNEARE